MATCFNCSPHTLLASLLIPCCLLAGCKDDPPPIPTPPIPTATSAPTAATATQKSGRTTAAIKGDIAAAERAIAALQKQAPRMSDQAKAKKLNEQIEGRKRALAGLRKELAAASVNPR